MARNGVRRLPWVVAIFLYSLSPVPASAGDMWALMQRLLLNQPSECSVDVAFADLPEGTRWFVSPDDRTIKGALQRWSNVSGWKLYWESPFDYQIIERVDYPQLCFGDALQALLMEVSQSGAGYRAVFYSGNRVLRIVPVRKL